MKITITMDVADDFVDDEDKTGVTAQGYDEICAALDGLGWDIEVRRAE